MPLFHIFAAPVLSGHPYLDPGSGSLLLQLILAAGLGGLFVVKVFWKKITSLFKKNDPDESSDPTDMREDNED